MEVIKSEGSKDSTMEIRIIILSVACFSCLVPPALSTGVIATAAAAKGAALLGAGALAAKGALIAKGLVGAKLAAIGAAKVAAIKGAALLASGAAAKGLALGSAAISAKANIAAAALSSAPVLAEPVIVAEAAPAPTLVRTIAVNSLPLPSVKDKVSAVVGTAKSIVDFKSAIISRLLGAIKAKIDGYPPIVYQMLPPALPVYRRPVVEVVEIDKRKK